jgi:hypothetical protein
MHAEVDGWEAEERCAGASMPPASGGGAARVGQRAQPQQDRVGGAFTAHKRTTRHRTCIGRSTTQCLSKPVRRRATTPPSPAKAAEPHDVPTDGAHTPMHTTRSTSAPWSTTRNSGGGGSGGSQRMPCAPNHRAAGAPKRSNPRSSPSHTTVARTQPQRSHTRARRRSRTQRCTRWSSQPRAAVRTPVVADMRSGAHARQRSHTAATHAPVTTATRSHAQRCARPSSQTCAVVRKPVRTATRSGEHTRQHSRT